MSKELENKQEELDINQELVNLEQDEVFDYLLTNYSSKFRNVKELREFIRLNYQNNLNKSLDFIIKNMDLSIQQMRTN